MDNRHCQLRGVKNVIDNAQCFAERDRVDLFSDVRDRPYPVSHVELGSVSMHTTEEGFQRKQKSAEDGVLGMLKLSHTDLVLTHGLDLLTDDLLDAQSILGGAFGRDAQQSSIAETHRKRTNAVDKGLLLASSLEQATRHVTPEDTGHEIQDGPLLRILRKAGERHRHIHLLRGTLCLFANSSPDGNSPLGPSWSFRKLPKGTLEETCRCVDIDVSRKRKNDVGGNKMSMEIVDKVTPPERTH